MCESNTADVWLSVRSTHLNASFFCSIFNSGISPCTLALILHLYGIFQPIFLLIFIDSVSWQLFALYFFCILLFFYFILFFYLF